jgi:hypothetical protein
MKTEAATFVLVLSVSSFAGAADSSARTSPVDNNSACMDRTVDASTGNCVIKDEGTPRRAHPPTKATKPATTPGVAASASSSQRGAVGK